MKVTKSDRIILLPETSTSLKQMESPQGQQCVRKIIDGHMSHVIGLCDLLKQKVHVSLYTNVWLLFTCAFFLCNSIFLPSFSVQQEIKSEARGGHYLKEMSKMAVL